MLSEIINTVVLNVAVWFWLAAAVVLWILARHSRRRLVLALVFLLVLWVSGTAPFARLILRPLETQHNPPSLADLKRDNVKRVVVLTGGGYSQFGDLTASALPHASTFRFLAGLELCNRLAPDCEIIFSGSAGSSNTNLHTAASMQDLAKILSPQIPTQSETNSNSTIEHPQNVKPFVGDSPFVLVTSAYHMPRAMLVFTRAGEKAIPYPVDYYSSDAFSWDALVPSSSNWVALNLALHEYLGILSYSLQK